MIQLRMILGTLAGLAIIGGAGYGWKFMELDGFIAFIMLCSGVSLIGGCLTLPGETYEE